MKTFRQFFEQKESKSLTATFGRFNPPTIGHEKVFNRLEEVSGGGDFRAYISQTQKPGTDPLGYEEKVKFLKEMFPRYEDNIVYDTNIRTILNVLTQAYDDGYTKFTLVVGDDRFNAMKTLAEQYHGVEGKAHGFYQFPDGLEFVNAGKRNKNAPGVEGMSASKLKDAVYRDDFQGFVKGLPEGYAYSHELFAAVKKGMGLPSDEEIATLKARGHK